MTGYIVYSSLGSFFIPLIMILFLYFKIFLTQRQMMAKKKKKVMICENLFKISFLSFPRRAAPSAMWTRLDLWRMGSLQMPV